MDATGKTEAAVMRSLVCEGVKAERSERAARDPLVGPHTTKLERRLSLKFHTLRRLTATTIVLAHAAIRILETYVAVEPSPADAEVAARKKAFFHTLYRRLIGEAESERLMEGMLDERDNVLSLLAEKELITALRDEDLEALLKDLIPQPDGAPNLRNNSPAASPSLRWTESQDGRVNEDLSKFSQELLTDRDPSMGEPCPGLINLDASEAVD